VKKNEIKNFVKQYKNTICLGDDLKPMKLVDCLETKNSISCLVVKEDGEKKELSPSDKIIPLKGRLKDRDYNYIEAQFYKKAICLT
jgi:hypothetical protein